jgi:sec-independent protein translocase protein TatA
VFGGHIWELVIVLALALVVFGPKRLPEIGGAMGKGIKEFRKSTSDPVELVDSGIVTQESAASAPNQAAVVSNPDVPSMEPEHPEPNSTSVGSRQDVS